MSVSPVAVGVLSSWKEIASHLGVGVRTAQGWERERGLPVHRLPGPRGRVYATIAELDAWQQPSSEPLGDSPAAGVLRSRQWSRHVVLGLAVLFLALVVTFSVRRAALAVLRVEHDALLGLTESGRVLWRQEYGSLRADAYTDGDQRTWVGDLGNGQPAALFVPTPAGILSDPVPLVCLDRYGRERWRFTPGKAVTHQADTFDASFVVRQFAVIGNKIIVTSHHHLYYPSQVAVLDAHGKLLREYWHPGHLNVLTIGRHEGRTVAFLGGVNNTRHAATLVVLDPERMTGSAIEHDQPSFDGMTPGAEDARILFPRAGINTSDPYNVVVQLFAQPNQLIVHVQERLAGTDPPTVLYHLNPRLDLTQVAFSDIFLSEHRQQTGHDVTTAENARLHDLTRIP